MDIEYDVRLLGWAPRKTKVWSRVRSEDGRGFIVVAVLWVDTGSEPKRARVMVRPDRGKARGSLIELCACTGCQANGMCRVRDGEPNWHEHVAMMGSGPQGPEYARREQRRRDKGWL